MRPDEVAQIKQFGHWECDLIQLRKKFSKANVTSIVERVSRFTVLLRNNDRQSKEVMTGISNALASLPFMLPVASLSIAARNFLHGPIYKRISVLKYGFVTLRRRGKREPLRTPI